MQTIMTVAGALGGLELLKWVFTLRSSGRRAEAEADSARTDATARSMKMYEESILFLQSQLRDREEAYAAMTSRLHEAMASELELTRRLGETEVKYVSSRCDVSGCRRRQPPRRDDSGE